MHQFLIRRMRIYCFTHKPTLISVRPLPAMPNIIFAMPAAQNGNVTLLAASQEQYGNILPDRLIKAAVLCDRNSFDNSLYHVSVIFSGM
jgi:hypothetical protein